MRSKVILLVEDHDDSRLIYSAILRHHGYAIVEAHDGAQGLDLARRHQPDLILLDVGLPVLDGWSAAEQLREHVATSCIPIVALTAHAFFEDRERGMQMGFSAYLVKPCKPSTVLAEVRRLIGPAAIDTVAG
jgi:two-component system, cell cycle response regulator DivK